MNSRLSRFALSLPMALASAFLLASSFQAQVRPFELHWVRSPSAPEDGDGDAADPEDR